MIKAHTKLMEFRQDVTSTDTIRAAQKPFLFLNLSQQKVPRIYFLSCIWP